MSERYLWRVSCKCALYSPDGTKVLLSEYGPRRYGLPGGHVEEGETPDQAMVRELREELGVANVSLEHRDFWMHDNGKIILGYTGTLDENTQFVLQEEEISDAVWTNIDDIESGRIEVNSYANFVCAFRPSV